MRAPRRLAWSAVVVTGALALAGTLPSTASAAPTAGYVVRPGTNQVEVLGAAPGDTLTLAGPVHRTGTADAQGSFEWRLLPPGSYTVTDGSRTDAATVTAFDSPPPAQSFYRTQTLANGFGYLTTRDGTTLSANVVLPSSGQWGPGPYPTVVEYSGYDPSNPANTTMAQLFNALGFAYVGVNIRGTGCSGGSFFNFEPVQSLDGYDAIETIAAQPWVQGGKVGMVGISYPGISQLYVARTRPPHLSAISPLSVMDDTYLGTLYPGGILNTGFAVPWAKDRATQSAPYGQAWTKTRADGGDTTCADNQLLRLQNPDPLAMVRQYPFRSPYPYVSVSPASFVGRIDVPTFLAGVWQDEQTGGRFPDMLARFTTQHLYATMTNGSHADSLANLNICQRLTEFLDLYVAKRTPTGMGQIVCPVVAQQVTGISGLTMPADSLRFVGLSYAKALALFQTQPRYRVLFESGAASGEPGGAPVARFEKSFTSWPPPATATSWFLTPRGKLSSTHVTRHRKARSFSADPTALPATDYAGSDGGIWAAHPAYDWRQIPHGTGLGWITPSLKRTQVMVGTGSVNLWVRTPAPDVDLEVTLTEVRPNGREVYVQAGWLRASHRKLARQSTPLLPIPTHLQSDARPMPSRVWQKLRIELFPFAHAFRRGSRIRITVDAPGNDRPRWAFATLDHGQKVAVAAGPLHRSKIVLPLVSGVTVPAGSPACGDLRSQPCRTYP